MKTLNVFEGNIYAQDRRKNRKYEAALEGFLADPSRWKGPTEEDKKAVELVRAQMKIMESDRKRKLYETDLIRHRFEEIMTEIENTNRFKRVRSQTFGF